MEDYGNRKPSPEEQGPQNPEATMVEQKVELIRAKVEAQFAQTDFPELIELGELPGIIESNAISLSHALADLDLFPAQYNSQFLDALNGRAHKLKVTQAQVLAINEHPYTHTLSPRQLTQMWDISIAMIKKVVENEDIKPVKPGKSGAVSKSMYSLYDIDQIEKIRVGLGVFDPPQGFVAESAILGTTNITSGALADIALHLEIKPLPFHNKDIGGGEYFFKEHDVIRILYAILEHKKAKKK